MRTGGQRENMASSKSYSLTRDLQEFSAEGVQKVNIFTKLRKLTPEYLFYVLDWCQSCIYSFGAGLPCLKMAMSFLLTFCSVSQLSKIHFCAEGDVEEMLCQVNSESMNHDIVLQVFQ